MRISPTPTNCCGCTACANICPKHAITMTHDEKGFSYPHINELLCVDCGLCEKTCQFHIKYQRYNNYNKPIVFAARHKNRQELANSQSGGISSILLNLFFRQNGIAYGVGFSKDFSISHIRVSDFESTNIFRGSKYVQSDLQGVFKSIKEDLQNENRVFFIGTPCQVAGLKACIPNKLHQDLFTIDLVCHCNSSPLIWKTYIKYIEEKENSKIINANFRDKKYGWNQCFETYEFENGNIIKSRSFDDLYFKHLSVRPSCTKCPFTNLNRVGDITLGDFWGWEKKHQEFNDNLGINLVLINSPKGESLFEECIPFIEHISSNCTECLQPQLERPITLNPQYNEFWDFFLKKGIKKSLYKYGDKNYFRRIKSILYRVKKHINNNT